MIDEYKQLADSKMKLQKETKDLKKNMEAEFSEYSKRKADQMKKLKTTIKQLKTRLDDILKADVNLAKYSKLKDTCHALAVENDQLNHTALKLKDQVDDLNQKKNRLNFLVFLCMKEGYPVGKLYKNEVKPIDSHRFDILTPSKFKRGVKKINEDIKNKKRSKSQDKSDAKESNGLKCDDSFEELPEDLFDEKEDSQLLNKSQDFVTNRTIGINHSYDAIVEGPPIMPKKLPIVPSLDFNKLSEYNKALKEAKKKRLQAKQMDKQGPSGEEFDEIESLLNMP